jgi:tRNA 2-thiouridine synthesizing protein A
VEDADITIDARGHQCPVPTLRLRKLLETLADGARIRLLADDPMALIDVPLFIKQAGHRLEYHTKTGSIITFSIIKVKGAAPLP